MSQLPGEWAEQPISAVADFVRGVTYKKPQSRTEPGAGFMPLLRATNIDGNALHVDRELVFVPAELVKDGQHLRKGDVVLATSSGSSTVVGKSGRLSHDWEGTFGAFCAVLRSKDRISPEYLSYFVQSDAVRRGWSQAAQGTNINNLKRADVERTLVPVPPPEEQQRIVEAIEEQFSRLDAGVESLQRAKRNLAHFRASVLRAAVEGRLVEHADERSSQLDLKASLIEQRRMLHEVENPGKHFREPGPVEALGPTPAHWSVVPLSSLAETRLGKMLSKKSKTGIHPRPYLRNLNVQWHRFDLSDVAEMDIHEEEVDRYRLRPGDLLVCEGGEVGRCAVWEGAESEMYCQKALHRVRPIPGVSSYYLALVFEYLTSNKLIGSFVTGSTIDHLPQEDLRRLPIPVPPSEEQLRILGEVDRITSITKAVAEAVNVGRQRANVLRNAVLRDAFNGSLLARPSLT